jgi:hypothetical protein
VMNLFFLPELYSNVMKLSSFVMSSRDAQLSFWAAELAAVVVAATSRCCCGGGDKGHCCCGGVVTSRHQIHVIAC